MVFLRTTPQEDTPMSKLFTAYTSLAASGRLPMYIRLAVMALGLASAVIGADLGAHTVFADGDDSGW